MSVAARQHALALSPGCERVRATATGACEGRASIVSAKGAFAPRGRPRALGIFAAAAGSAVALGPPFGGAVVQGISWPWIFWLNLPLAAALITIARVRVDEQHGPWAVLDGHGLVLVTAAAA